MARLLWIATLLSILGPGGAHANPDVWVKAVTTFQFEDGQVAGLGFEWQFDPYFSSRTIALYDRNRNGSLEPDEVARLRQEAFDPLKGNHYYVHVWVDEEKREDLSVEDFEASVRGDVVVYRFWISVTPPADPSSGPIIVSLFDRETIVDFRFVESKFLHIEGTVSPKCTFQIARGKGDQARHPQAVTLLCGGT